MQRPPLMLSAVRIRLLAKQRFKAERSGVWVGRWEGERARVAGSAALRCAALQGAPLKIASAAVGIQRLKKHNY